MAKTEEEQFIFEVLIEDTHLAGLNNLKKRLFTENRMNGDEMRDWAQSLEVIVRYIEGCIEPAQLKRLEERRSAALPPLGRIPSGNGGKK